MGLILAKGTIAYMLELRQLPCKAGLLWSPTIVSASIDKEIIDNGDLVAYEICLLDGRRGAVKAEDVFIKREDCEKELVKVKGEMKDLLQQFIEKHLGDDEILEAEIVEEKPKIDLQA